MRSRCPLLAAAILAVIIPSARTDEKPAIANGNYILSLVSGRGDLAVGLLKVETEDGKPLISVVAAPPTIEVEISDVKSDGGLSFTVKRTQTVKDRTGKERKLSAEGTFVAAPGEDAKLIRGSFGSGSQSMRAKLTATSSEKLTTMLTLGPAAGEMAKITQLGNAPLLLRSRAAREKDAGKKKELRDEAVAAQEKADAQLPDLYRQIITKHPEADAALDAALSLLRSAEKYKVTPDEAAKLAALIEGLAKPYGARYSRPTAISLAETLVRQKGLEKVALGPIAPVAKGLTDKDPLQFQFDTLTTYKAALEGAGKRDEVKSVTARLTELDTALDKEYLATVPPFKPDPFPGRNDTSANRTVVMELFTGAQCGPCIAADVACDAILKSYKPSELILLQYHVHIPGPDPLTNADTVARWDYYTEAFPYDPDTRTGIGGTPSTLFNGKPEAGGGGPMTNAQPKFDQYRRIIDPLLEKSTKVKMTGSASREGDRVAVDVAVAGLDSTDNLHLRILLVEDVVKYVGSNRIRFHHHVVREMLGGAGGFALKDVESREGTYNKAVTVDLSELRKEIAKYLDDYAANERPFRDDARPLDLKALKAIALIQNDKTQEILQAVQLEVKSSAAGGE
jgi:hypothetical protein